MVLNNLFIFNFNKKMKKFYIKLLFLLIPIISLALYNYILDPYSVLKKDITKEVITGNYRYIKVKHVLENPNKYNSFLFGSSRANYIDIEKVRSAKFYNLFYGSSTPSQWLYDLNLLLNKNIKIQNIVLALDDFSFKLNQDKKNVDLFFKPYPTTFNESLYFYISYIFAKPNLKIFKLFVKKKKKIRWKKTSHIFTNGRIDRPERDVYIENNKMEHISDSTFKQPFYVRGNRINKTIESISSIKNVCKKNNINLIIVINPVHKTTYLANDITQFNLFKKKLSGITPFWDFSGLNSITSNNYYYYETSHFRHKVGNMILAKIFNIRNIFIPKDFGMKITRRNIDKHINQLSRQLKNR